MISDERTEVVLSFSSRYLGGMMRERIKLMASKKLEERDGHVITDYIRVDDDDNIVVFSRLTGGVSPFSIDELQKAASKIRDRGCYPPVLLPHEKDNLEKICFLCLGLRYDPRAFVTKYFASRGIEVSVEAGFGRGDFVMDVELEWDKEFGDKQT